MAEGGHLRRRVCAAALLFAAACAAPVRREPIQPFFPPPPAAPRLQYLTSFGGRADIERQSAFSRFVVGQIADVRVDKPYGVALHDGKIYVCDTNATVVVFDLEDRSFGALKGATGAGRLSQPINISVEPDGTKYVADPVRGQVVAFDRNDDYLRAYGTAGGWRPVDAVAFEDRLYVADVANGLVKIFAKQGGELLATLGDKGEPAERLDRPTNLAVDPEGALYVTDVGRFQVVKFDREGRFQATFGQPGDGLGAFARPKGIVVDRAGRLYAVDASFNNVQIFDGKGRLLLFFGEGGDDPGDFLLPAKVALDYDNLRYFTEYVKPGFEAEYLVLVTSQFGERAVSVLAYGRELGREYPSDAELLREIDARRKGEQGKAQPQ